MGSLMPRRRPLPTAYVSSMRYKYLPGAITLALVAVFAVIVLLRTAG
jgi:hypothetical protein